MSPAGPRFSLVGVVGDDAAVLPDFLASLDAQTFGLDDVQVVLVDTGVDPELALVLRGWAAARPTATVLSVPGAGHVPALNAGLAAATGTWVSFPEVADVLAPPYLKVVDRFLTKFPSTALVATNRLNWDPVTGDVNRKHPLRALFQGNNLVDLTTSTWHFHESAAAAFFPREPVHAAGLTFDPELPASFAGGHFLARYLIEVGHPAVGFLRRARYHLRKRTRPPGPQFTDAQVLFERGYADLVQRARTRLHELPAWLQRLLAFELTRFLDRAEGASTDQLAPDDDVDAFHRRIAGLIKAADLVEPIERAQFFVPRTVRLALMHGYRPESWVDDHVLIDKVDEAQGLVRARYYFTGVAPPEQVVNGGVRTAPVHAKTRTLTYLGRAPLCERILWVRPDPDLAIAISGEPADLRFQRPSFPTTTLAPAALDWNFGLPPGRVAADVARHYLPTPQTREGWDAQQAVDSPAAVRDYADAWVFMDKVHCGRDNGEFLFEHVVAHHPEINAWFVVEEGTSTWRRLRKAHGNRVVAHGSHQWRVLMAHCTQLLSSHADAAVLKSRDLADFMRPRWRFTHLDHGVRKDDSSRWLGARPIDTLVATTTAEHAAIAGDGNDYPFTTKEVQLTGMPRLDRLVGYDQQIPPGERDLLLVAPTWREWLVPPLVPGSHRRGLDRSALDSEFVARWTELLASHALRDLCEQQGLTLTLLPHPNIEALLDALDLPDHVAVVSYEEDDVQAVFARSRLLVTDFSSVAFDVAYVNRPVVYYQFDRQRFRSTATVLREGYFSYERDGFGPVTHSSVAAVTAIGAALRSGTAPSAPYDARIAATFPFTDAGCCERVIAAVRRGSDAPGPGRAGVVTAN